MGSCIGYNSNNDVHIKASSADKTADKLPKLKENNL